MYCRNCGNLISDNSELCAKCGCRPENGTEYCPKCGARAAEKQAVCAKCGYGLNMESFYASWAVNFSSPVSNMKLSPYYQKEFQKIHNSKGAYRGRFNIWGFLFGPFWALVKKGSVLPLLACFLTAGFGWIVAALYYGIRGTYSYYEDFLIAERVAAWRSVTDLKK